MVVRVAEIDDFKRVHELVYDIYEKYLTNRPDIFKVGDPYKLEQFKETLEDKNQVIVLGIKDDEVIGLCHMLKKEFRGNEIKQDGVNVFIENFGIDKKYRRKGFGRELLMKSIEQAKLWNASRVELNVWSFNEEAEKFFKAMGLKNKSSQMEYRVI